MNDTDLDSGVNEPPEATALVITKPVVKPTRDLPASEEAEQHVLAVCLLDGGDTVQRCLDAKITAHSFYWPINQALFRAIEKMYLANQPVSVETIIAELHTNKALDEVGGLAHLMDLTGKIQTTTHARFFIDKVREKELLRATIKAATQTVEDAYNFSGGLDEFLGNAKARIEGVTDSKLDDNALDLCEFNSDQELPKPETVVSIAGTQVCTPGNLTTLYSQAKVGKTATAGALIAAAIAVPGQVADTLGINGSNITGKAFIHFDTEQSKYDRQQMIKTALRRVNQSKPPKWFKSYILTGKSAEECRILVEKAIKLNAQKFGGIFEVIIDGVGDLVNSPNNEEECFPLVTKLHSLAIKYDCPIINVLHLNPGTESDKGRGHLGSQLERKSESNLMLEKDENGVTRLYATKQRGKMITKDKAVSFKWNDGAQMHLSCESEDHVKRGPKQRYFLSSYLSIFPTTEESAKTFPQLQRSATTKQPISRNTFWDLVADGVSVGEIIVNRANINEPRYWVKPLAPQS